MHHHWGESSVARVKRVSVSVNRYQHKRTLAKTRQMKSQTDTGREHHKVLFPKGRIFNRGKCEVDERGTGSGLVSRAVTFADELTGFARARMATKSNFSSKPETAEHTCVSSRLISSIMTASNGLRWRGVLWCQHAIVQSSSFQHRFVVVPQTIAAAGRSYVPDVPSIYKQRELQCTHLLLGVHKVGLVKESNKVAVFIGVLEQKLV